MEDMTTLISNDGQKFQVLSDMATKCETIKDLLEDIDSDSPIPLPEVSGNILMKVLEYAEYHLKGAENSSWETDFCNVDQKTLFALILAANYLNYKELLDFCCRTVANIIKGKTPDELRILFKIKNDSANTEQ